MTARALYRYADVVYDAVAAVAGTVQVSGTGVPVDVHELASRPVGPAVLVEASDAAAVAGPPMAGDQWATVPVRVIAIGATLAQALGIRGELHYLLAGRDAAGGFITPLPVAGFAVVDRAVGDVGPGEVLGGVPQASLEVTLTLERAS